MSDLASSIQQLTAPDLVALVMTLAELDAGELDAGQDIAARLADNVAMVMR